MMTPHQNNLCHWSKVCTTSVATQLLDLHELQKNQCFSVTWIAESRVSLPIVVFVVRSLLQRKFQKSRHLRASGLMICDLDSNCVHPRFRILSQMLTIRDNFDKILEILRKLTLWHQGTHESEQAISAPANESNSETRQHSFMKRCEPLSSVFWF